MIIARTPTKRIIICTIGQSNEVGHCQDFSGTVDVTFTASLGACSDKVQPNGGSEGSLWPLFVDHMARDRIAVTVKNTAVGATALVEDWLGDSAGDGTGTPFNSSDGGFDPNSYLSDALAEVDSGTYDEAWALIAFGQKDGGNDVSLANYQLALENATNYFLDNDVKVALGMSFNTNPINTWMVNKGYPALTAALSTFSSNSNVVAGANMYTYLGSIIPTGYLQTDGNHGTPDAYKLYAKAWYEALSGTVFTQ